jgi:hypothetical protein
MAPHPYKVLADLAKEAKEGFICNNFILKLLQIRVNIKM